MQLSQLRKSDPEKAKRVEAALEAAGQHYVEATLIVSPARLGGYKFGEEKGIDQGIVSEWVAEKRAKDDQERSAREERLIKATEDAQKAGSGSMWAAIAAAIAAGFSAIGTIAQAIAAYRSLP
jgi:hypothetical protein